MTEKEYRDQIYKKAANVKTKADLDALLAEIQAYRHDYGTIVYGCMAAMKGAFNYINRSDAGGITGFQAGCLGWECVREFMSISGPARIIDYDKLLYPQYSATFDRTITPETAKWVKEQAEEKLKENESQIEQMQAHPTVMDHWRAIAAGQIPFGLEVKGDA